MTGMGQERRFRDVRDKSGLPPTPERFAASQRTDGEGQELIYGEYHSCCGLTIQFGGG